MREAVRELQTFNLATKKWFNDSLSHSDYYLKSSDLRKERLYSLFCRQLFSDVQQQQTIIDQNFIARKGVVPTISEKGKEMKKNLEQLLLSPNMLSEDCPLETKIIQNWSLGTDTNVPTIPNLLEDFVHEEAKNFSYSPTSQEGEKHKYARYDIDKSPRAQEYIEELKKFILTGLPEGVSSDDLKVLLVRTGASIFPDILQILNPSSDNKLPIEILNKIPYFEAEKAIRMRELKSLTNVEVNCYYVEPIGNNSLMDVPNLKKTIESIKNIEETDQKTKKNFLIIDLAVMGGQLELKKFFKPKDFDNLNLIVIESANKFLSYGTNKANLGFVYGLGPDTDWFFDTLKERIQMTGLPDYRSILSIPLPNQKIVVERKERFNFNTHFLAQNLYNNFKDKLFIVYPGLKNHPQHQQITKEYGFHGSLIFIQLPEVNMYEKAESLLGDSKIIGLGTSYGFNKARAEVIRKKNNGDEKQPLGLRISVGTENIRELILVYEELQGILTKVLE